VIISHEFSSNNTNIRRLDKHDCALINVDERTNKKRNQIERKRGHRLHDKLHMRISLQHTRQTTRTYQVNAWVKRRDAGTGNIQSDYRHSRLVSTMYLYIAKIALVYVINAPVVDIKKMKNESSWGLTEKEKVIASCRFFSATNWGGGP
jgi:hypothetical protein